MTVIEQKGGAVLPRGPAPLIKLPTKAAEKDKQYSLDDIDPVGRTDVVIYGPPGSCKTMLWSTMPPPFRVIDGDYGLKTLKWAFKAGLTALHCTGPHCLVAYRPVEQGTYPINPEALDKMTDMLDFWFSPGEVEKWEGGTLVWDSATEVNVWAIYKALHVNGQLPKPDKSLSISDKVNEVAHAILLTGEQDYKSAQGFFLGLLADIRVECARHNRNFAMVCHQWTETAQMSDGSTRVVSYEPWLIGQLRQRIAKDFDDVWYTQLFNGKDAKVQVHGDPMHVAKTRWGQVPEIEKDFDYRKMIERVRRYHGTT